MATTNPRDPSAGATTEPPTTQCDLERGALGGRAVAKAAWFVVQKSLRPLQFVLTAAGCPLVRWWDQDMQLRQAWQEIYRFPEGVKDDHVVQAFRTIYGSRLPQWPEQPLPPLTSMILKQAATQHKARTAAGACGWRKAELTALPMMAWEELAELLNLCEEAHQLPAPFHQTWISMIPKPNAKGPMDLRPIGVTSLVYRTWAKAKKLQLLSTWYQAVLLPEHYGAAPARSAEQVRVSSRCMPREPCRTVQLILSMASS